MIIAAFSWNGWIGDNYSEATEKRLKDTFRLFDDENQLENHIKEEGYLYLSYSFDEFDNLPTFGVIGSPSAPAFPAVELSEEEKLELKFKEKVKSLRGDRVAQVKYVRAVKHIGLAESLKIVDELNKL